MPIIPRPFSSDGKVRRITIYAIIAALVWSALLLMSYWSQQATRTEDVKQLAIVEARTAFEKDILYRRWVARHGGVYVRITDETKPNPILAHIPERDITTPSGVKLTLVNPAYMTRQVFEAAKNFNGPQGHITSLTPLHQANTPDPWEAAALKRLEQGVYEVTGIVPINGKPYMRLIRPFQADETCITCHGHQELTQGDIIGGISVSVAMDDRLSALKSELRQLALWHGLFWMLGITAIGFGELRLSRDTRALISSESQLNEKNDELVITEEELRQQLDEYLHSQYELMVEKEKLNTVMSCMGDGLAIIGTDFRILYQNRALRELFGPAGGAFCYATYQHRSKPCSDCPVSASFREGGIHTRTVPMKIAGKVVWFETTTSPYHDAMGRVVGSVQIYRNIDDRKRHQQEIENLNASLEQRIQERTADLEHSNSSLETANREMEAFSYSVSHDLRAPLRHINGFSQALVEEYSGQLDEQGKDYLRRICAASDHMAALIDDLLELSRVTRTELRRQRVDMSELCRTIAANLNESYPEREATFVIADGAVAQGDPLLIRQALENILGNAWKYTSKTHGARIEFGISPNQSTTTYFVRDNGVGFDMAYSGKLFGAFQRLHGAEFEGTGIGLATVQRIIQRHGGTIWAEGSEGHGATFYFTL